MKMRYKQQLHAFVQHLQVVLGYYNNEYMGSPWRQDRSELSLSSWGYPLYDKEKAKREIQEEHDAFLFLSSCQLGIVSNGYTRVDRPSVDVLIRAVDRFVAFMSTVYGKDLSNFESLDHKKPNREYLLDVKKKYRALKYYRFQATLQGWYGKLPECCPTWEEKYAKL